MKQLYYSLYFLFALSFSGQAQTTREFFSRQGLTINAYHYNFFEGYSNRSLRYVRDSITCNDTLLLFQYTGLPNAYEFLRIDSGKVFLVLPGANCAETLFYDFDLEVGDTFDGTSTGSTLLYVIEKDYYTLVNNELRRYLKLTDNPVLPGYTIEWMEGIGDLQKGLLPFFPDFEGYDQFVCARDTSSEILLTPGFDEICDSFTCQTPYAGFEFTKNDKVVSFNNTTLNASTYIWDFGDGNTSTSVHPVHEYTAPGCYTITLKAYTDCLENPNVFTHSISVCLNGGWEQKPMPIPVTATEIAFVNDTTGYVIADYKLFHTHDGANSWEPEVLPLHPITGDSYITSRISMINRDSGLIRGGYLGVPPGTPLVLFTADGGVNWTPSLTESEGTLSGVAMVSGGRAAVTELSHHVYFSDDYGQQWNKVDYPAWGFPQLTHAINVIPAGNDFCVYGFIESWGPSSFPFLYFTNDQGLNWRIVALHGEQTTYGVFFLNELNGWVTGKNGILLHTIDGGETWDHINTGIQEDLHEVAFADTLNGWAVGMNGVILHTTDGGETWLRENCESTIFFGHVATSGPQTAYTTGGSATLLKYQDYGPSPCVWSSTQENYPINPGAWTIIPNPADSRIQIVFDPNSVEIQDVLAQIYNGQGQIVQEVRLSGHYKDIDITGLPQGIYFVTLSSSGFNLQGKVLVKM